MTKKNVGGRPTKLNDELIEKFAQLVSIGMPVETVCWLLSIPKQYFYNWMQKGENTHRNNIYRKFYDAIKKADGQFVFRNLATIQKAADNGDVQASKWLLERRYPQYFGRTEVINYGDFRIEVIEKDAKEVIENDD